MQQRVSRLFCAGLLVLCALSLKAAPEAPGPLVFSDAYVRASVPGQSVGAAYVSIHNHGPQDDFLIAAHSSAAASVDLHSSHNQQGMTHMQRESRLRIPAGGALQMQPGGVHLMLQNLKTPLKAGEQVTLQLVFEKAGTQHLTLPVRALSAESSSGTDSMPGMSMPGMRMDGPMNGPQQGAHSH